MKSSNSQSEKNAKKNLENIISNYLSSNPMLRSDRKTNEIEMRFGKNKKQTIGKMDFDNVAQTLINHGFKMENPNGFYSLRMYPEYLDGRTGQFKQSRIRAEVVGKDLIQKYCETNSLQKILDMPSTNYEKLKFTQKTKPKDQNEKYIDYADFDDFNMRVAFQLEQTYTARAPIIKTMVDNWMNSKKTYRLLHRIRFVHPTLPIFADLSILKNSKKTGNVPMKFYNIQDANVFDSPESYEIEMEIDNTMMGTGRPYDNVKSIVDVIRKSLRIVLCGLQQTNYPISYIEEENIQNEYMKLLFGEDHEQSSRITPQNFIGPSSHTLEIQNIVEKNENLSIPNIREEYTVTDKADGERQLLFINSEGKLYTINTNMHVIFTGAKTVQEDLFNSLLDGEFIKKDKNDTIINLFAAFDIYYKNKRSCREFKFVQTTTGEKNDENEKNEKKDKDVYRLALLKLFVNKLKIEHITKTDEACKFNVEIKNFYTTSNNVSIFEACSNILSNIDDGIYRYETDGLIFTPANKMVGEDDDGVVGPLKKSSWKHSFKWKPPEFNTVDFLVTVKKDQTGKDEIKSIFEDGVNVATDSSFTQYKTLILRCGYNEKIHGYLNPFHDMNNENFAKEESEQKKYKPVPFQPTNPYDNKACYANMLLKNSKDMITENGETFGENMIVEFKYDLTKENGWKWIPLRVRYDKTHELHNGMPNYGNAYHVANSIWQTIHNPITNIMIKSGQEIPDEIHNNEGENTYDADEGVYYNRDSSAVKKTRSLRDFHNLYVKNTLIKSVSNQKDTLIDYACGKAGDLHKWIYAKLAFVLGIDISKDNIHNRLDGACARYLKDKASFRSMPGALFVNGNSGLNIRDGQAFNTQKDRELAQAIFGNGPKDQVLLGKGVYKNYGVAEEGFHVSSCQFALHYFFENAASLHNFARNLSECTRLNGYFIGCCYDGKTVFKMLQNKEKGEKMTLMENGRKMFEMTKDYHETGFSDDDTSLGYSIQIFQETIGKTFREYLVNFDYFIDVMETYGFKVLSKEEANPLGLPNGSGMFDEMFHSMETEISSMRAAKHKYKNAPSMTLNEKKVSFLNRYFVFQKMRHVNAEKLFKIKTTVDVRKEDAEEEAPPIIIKKQRRKIVIV